MAEGKYPELKDAELRKILEESAEVGRQIRELLVKRGELLVKADLRLKKLGIR